MADDKKKSRFRWTTLQQALDVLSLRLRTHNEWRRLFENLGCGDALDRNPPQYLDGYGLTLSKLCRQEPARRDTDGDLLSDRIVREAAEVTTRISESEARSFMNCLAVDGWTVSEGRLVPISPVPLEEPRSRLRTSLEALEATEALMRLDQLESSLDAGHWESANSSCRGFLNAVFERIAADRHRGEETPAREGEARKALQAGGFFKPDPRDASKSLEGAFVKALADLLGSEGAHTGTSLLETAAFRYAVTVLTADYFLHRHK